MAIESLVKAGKIQLDTICTFYKQFIGNNDVFILIRSHNRLAFLFFAFFGNDITCSIKPALEVKYDIGLLLEVESDDILARNFVLRICGDVEG